jgi:hypothetical protein
VKESIQDRKFKIQNGYKPHLDRDLRSLNFDIWIFYPILSQTLSEAAGLGTVSTAAGGRRDLQRIRVRVDETIAGRRGSRPNAAFGRNQTGIQNSRFKIQEPGIVSLWNLEY